MKKFYEEPEMIVRNYALPPNGVITTSGELTGGNSGSDLDDGDDYDYFK